VGQTPSSAIFPQAGAPAPHLPKYSEIRRKKGFCSGAISEILSALRDICRNRRPRGRLFFRESVQKAQLKSAGDGGFGNFNNKMQILRRNTQV
jgi:hypothetical protein